MNEKNNEKNDPGQKPEREGNGGQHQPNQGDPARREVQPPGQQSEEKKKNQQQSDDQQREERKRQQDREREKSDERHP